MLFDYHQWSFHYATQLLHGLARHGWLLREFGNTADSGWTAASISISISLVGQQAPQKFFADCHQYKNSHWRSAAIIEHGCLERGLPLRNRARQISSGLAPADFIADEYCTLLSLENAITTSYMTKMRLITTAPSLSSLLITRSRAVPPRRPIRCWWT